MKRWCVCVCRGRVSIVRALGWAAGLVAGRAGATHRCCPATQGGNVGETEGEKGGDAGAREGVIRGNRGGASVPFTSVTNFYEE